MAPEITSEAIAQIAPEDETERAAALVAKRLPALAAAGYDVAKRRLLGMLARRGYPGDLSIAVVDGALSEAGISRSASF